MADISQEIANIQSAARGEEIRSPIVSALNKMNAWTLPVVSASDSKKLLCVNSQGEWVASNEQYVPTPTGSLSINANGTYNVVDKAQAVVDVPTGPMPSGTIQITQNGTYDVTDKASAEVSVQGSLPVLVSKTISQNGSYSAADDNADGYSNVVVNVSGGSSVLVSKTISQNGTYNPSDDNADAYSQVVVNVSGGGSDDNFLIACGAKSGSIYADGIGAIRSSAFLANEYITGVEMPSTSVINRSAFAGCGNLTTVSFPSCVSIGSNAFSQCTSLSSVYLPLCEYLGSSAFAICCYALKEIDLPLCKTINNAVFSSCWSLAKIKLESCTTIGDFAFYRCSRLTELIILTESVCVLNGRSAFDGSGLRLSTHIGRYGSVYVPASLVETYKSAAYWSAISDRITSYVEE